MTEKIVCGFSLISKLACGTCEECTNNIQRVKSMINFYECRNIKAAQSAHHILIKSTFFELINIHVKTINNRIIIEFDQKVGDIVINEKTADLLCQLVYLDIIKERLDFCKND